MVFSGITFLYYFLPGVLIAYFLIQAAANYMRLSWVSHHAKNVVLLAASLFFYAWGEPVYVFLMLLSILIGYVAGRLLEKTQLRPIGGIVTPKLVLTLTVTLFAGVFVVFKYTDFMIENINAAVGVNIPLRHIVLPIGISFYTFQIISYLVDVYRREVPAQKNLISLALYISMFPQLIAGPIVRYSTVAEQIDTRKSTWIDLESGITRFIIGLSKKVLIANELGRLCTLYKETTEVSVLYTWLYAIAVCLHIYFDFSGYSDMAIGLGKLFGFSFPENFNHPYVSGSVTEFWRRWHMSLGTWFRDYLYIPLGGNRVSKVKWYRNILIVWLFTGLWHGASWNFVVWGLFFAALLLLEKNWLLSMLNKTKILKHLYVILSLVISFVIFDGENLKISWVNIQRLFGFGKIPLYSMEACYYLRSFFVLLLVASIGATPLVKRVAGSFSKKHERVIVVLKPIGLLLLFVLSTAYLVDGSFNPFLYFRF